MSRLFFCLIFPIFDISCYRWRIKFRSIGYAYRGALNRGVDYGVADFMRIAALKNVVKVKKKT